MLAEETTTENNQVAIIKNSIEIFKEAPQILQANQLKTQKALAVGNQILEQWNAAFAIADEAEKIAALAVVDERSNNYLVNCNNAVKQQKELRAAITQMMDKFKGMFTDAENQIDKTKPGSVPATVQLQRDNYAKISFEIAEKKRKEAERIAAKAKEAIEIRGSYETRLSGQYNDYLLERKQAYSNSFNAITLDNFTEKEAALQSLKPTFKFIPKLDTLLVAYHDINEMTAIANEVINANTVGYENNFLAEINLQIADLLSKLPSKKSELLEAKRLADEDAAELEKQRKEKEQRDAAIAKANAEQKAKLEKEAEAARVANEKKNAELKAQQEKADAEKKQREEEENAKLLKEAEDAKANAALEADIKAQGDATMVMFEQEACLAESTPANTARQGYEIEVLHPVGYTQIFALWFENEGKNLGIDKIGNTKLDQMKAWAEKVAHKSGTKIESKFIKYVESFTAVNKKVK